MVCRGCILPSRALYSVGGYVSGDTARGRNSGVCGLHRGQVDRSHTSALPSG